MIPVLRPYQQDGLDAIRREFGRGIRSVLYQALKPKREEEQLQCAAFGRQHRHAHDLRSAMIVERGLYRCATNCSPDTERHP